MVLPLKDTKMEKIIAFWRDFFCIDSNITVTFTHFQAEDVTALYSEDDEGNVHISIDYSQVDNWEEVFLHEILENNFELVYPPAGEMPDDLIFKIEQKKEDFFDEVAGIYKVFRKEAKNNNIEK